MSTLTTADRIAAIGMASAQELNDEMTLIVSVVEEILAYCDSEDPVIELAGLIRASAQRCAWNAATLLQVGAKRGVRPVPTSAAQLVRAMEGMV